MRVDVSGETEEALLLVLFANYKQKDEDKDCEMRRTCSTNGGEEEFIQVIGGKVGRKETTRKTKT
jgi:hypothetical protein